MESFRNKVKVWFVPPGIRSFTQEETSLDDDDPRSRKLRQLHSTTPSRLNWYVFVQYLVTVFAAAFFLFHEGSFTLFHTGAAVILVLLTFLNANFLLERKRWSFLAEFFRLILGLLFLCALAHATIWFNAIFFTSAAIAFISLLWLSAMSHLFK